MNMRHVSACFAVALAAVATVGIGDAWARSAKLTSSLFLGYNQTQQSVYVRQMMDGNSDLVLECAPKDSVQQVTEELVKFMRMNPRYMQRPAHLPFTEMMLEKCKSAQSGESGERLMRR